MDQDEEEEELELELTRFQTSYIELLHRTSTEIEKLKLLIQILSCVHKKEPVPEHIVRKLEKNEKRLQQFASKHNNFGNVSMKNMQPNLELSLYHDMEMEQKVDSASVKQQIEILRDSKLTLIKSSSFEMDRLRRIIRYLESKISGNPYVASRHHAPSVTIDPAVPKKRLSEPNKLNDTQYSWKEIEKHCTISDLWVVHSGKIYDISKFLRFHPGGGEVIVEITSNNQDITDVLKQLNHPPIAQEIMVKHFIGCVAPTKRNHQTYASFVDLKPIWTPSQDVEYEMAEYPDEELLIKWIDELSVKIDILDKQHLHIIHIINNLYIKYELKDILELLHRWDVHCKTEETLFFYYHFDEEEQQKHIVDHKRIYHKIKDQITSLRIKYDNQQPRCMELIEFAKRFVKMFTAHHG
eukprot:415328_1